MKRQDPFDLNLNLLAYLEALIDERQVSRAAQKVNLSQPAMSLALKRLRVLFDDPLLVHTPKGLVPTPRAIELIRPVREIWIGAAPWSCSRKRSIRPRRPMSS